MVTKKLFGKQFTVWLLAGLTAIAALGYFAGDLAVKRVDDQFYAKETLAVELASQSVREALRLPASHLYSVVHLEPRMQEALNSQDGNLREVENAFTTLLLRNPNYAQVRWIGEYGMEIVRVDQKAPGIVKAKATDTLQDKSSRPYVQQGLQLQKDQLYVSPLDLNIENGEIQIPYMPVVRMALRAFASDGTPRGLVVLNISAAPMLDKVREFSATESIMLLNAEGYWLKSPDPADEWGFMLGRKETLGTRHPMAWQKINASASGYAETQSGLWTWQTIEVSESHLSVAHNLELKLVGLVSSENLASTRLKALAPILITIAITTIFYIVALYQLMREMADRRHAQQLAMQANRAKGAFLATMSHEIRTPMTGILGFADMLLEDDLAEESRKKVGRIKGAAQALLRILNDILDISKLDAGKFEIEKIPFRPDRLANDVVQLFYQTCPPEKKDALQITAKVSRTFPEVVCADPTRLRQVLVNLMGNAVKFSDRGSVTLVCDHDEARKRLEFEVIDTGIGMDQDMMDRLFQEFEQADATTSRKYHGTGLGLAICKKLVERMGGEIRARSTPGMGSALWFSVPYDPATTDDLPTEENSSPTIDASNLALSILVAEDNEINQMIIQNALKKLGHKATIAESGREALRLMEEPNDFDLILMDVRMPEMSGPEATRRIRALPGTKGAIPIIALTADVMEENKAAYFEAGMDDCVGKPVNHAELAAAINKAACTVSN